MDGFYTQSCDLTSQLLLFGPTANGVDQWPEPLV